MTTARILAFGGSLRRDSWNQKLAAIAAAGAREAGAEVTLIALRDFPLPLFDQDLEDAEGMPETAKKLKQLFREHHGLLIASPEYNSSITAALKNTIDWVSRSESDDEPLLVAYADKTAVLCSASPGGLGGLREHERIRSVEPYGAEELHQINGSFVSGSSHVHSVSAGTSSRRSAAPVLPVRWISRSPLVSMPRRVPFSGDKRAR